MPYHHRDPPLFGNGPPVPPLLIGVAEVVPQRNCVRRAGSCEGKLVSRLLVLICLVNFTLMQLEGDGVRGIENFEDVEVIVSIP